MKKIFRFLYIVLASILIMPIFAACNSEGATQTVAVRFSSAVYVVEYNVPTKISYQIYPSTSTNNRVEITFDIPTESGVFDPNKLLFTLKDPYITTDFQATIRVNNTFSDTCTIRPRVYPNSISLGKTSDVVDNHGIYGLQVKGLFGGQERVMDPSIYNLEIVSDDPSVLSVEGLNVVSTGKLGKARISIVLKDANGHTVLSNQFEPNSDPVETYIDLTVKPNVSSAKIALQGSDEFIVTHVNSYDPTNENKYLVQRASVKVMVELYSDDGYLVDISDVNIISVDPSVVTVERDEEIDNLFNINIAAPTSGNTTPYVRLEVVTSSTDSSGNPIKFVFYIARQSL